MSQRPKTGTSGFKAQTRENYYTAITDTGKSKVASVGHYRPKHVQVEKNSRAAVFHPKEGKEK